MFHVSEDNWKFEKVSYSVLIYLFYTPLYVESTNHNKLSLLTTKQGCLHTRLVVYDAGFKNTGFDTRQNYMQILVCVHHGI